jgi:2-polyprenyl-3-methyl-5-hydroxy-6-metoxy-1,4-benzoquinol methylase
METLQADIPQKKTQTKAELQAAIEQLAPFHHTIDLPHGLSTFVPSMARQDRDRTRMQTLIAHAWPSILAACGGTLVGKRVLDIACNCGGFSTYAAKAGAEYVLGVDIEPHYLKQANFIRDTLGLQNLEFQQLNLEDLDPAKHGMFDLVLCFGILYHLESPVLSLKRISAVTSKVLVVDTTLMRVPYIGQLLERWPLWHMRRVLATDTDATDIATSRWRPKEFCQFSPNSNGVINLLEYSGFSDIEKLTPKEKGLEKRYYNGQRATYVARKVPDASH